MSWYKKFQNEPDVGDCADEIGIQVDYWDSRGGEGVCTVTAYLKPSKVIVGRIDFNYIHNTGNAWIKWIEVIPECRYKGIGRNMIDALRDWLKSAGSDGVIEWSNTTDEGTMFKEKVDPVS